MSIVINLLSSVTIYRPINQVFEFMSCSENDFQWQYGTLSSARISEGATRVGSFFRSNGHLMGRRNHSTFEITEYEANETYGFTSVSGPVDSHTVYSFGVVPDSTKIDISTQVSTLNLPGIHEGVLEKHLKKQLRENLAMLKGILEAN
jgi:uncharacterized membrane protein